MMEGAVSGHVDLVFVGDIHLGRRPSRLPEGVTGAGLTAHDISPAAAWEATVEWALAHGVDVVVLAGDVVESLEDRFEAYPLLKRGVERLTEAGITVAGVAGNHDVHALPLLADRVEGFRLLGRGGVWERVTVTGASGAEVDLLGWSFPKQRVLESPVSTLAINGRDGVPMLGILHCDLDQAGSKYAPVRRGELNAAAGDGWFLGHIHKPDALDPDRPVGYLGSLVGLDPGEQGLRGPWHVRVDDGRIASVEQLRLAPVRWERQVVDAGTLTLDDGGDLRDVLSVAVAGAMKDIHDRLEDDASGLCAVGCRVVFSGPTEFSLDPVQATEWFAPQTETYDGVLYFVEKILDETTPAVDLSELSRADDPPGLLARKLLILEEDGEEAQALVREAEREMEQVSAAYRSAYDADEDHRVDYRRVLLRAGYDALGAFMTQRAAEEASS